MTRLIVALTLLIFGSDQAPRPRPVRWLTAAVYIACLALVGCGDIEQVEVGAGFRVATVEGQAAVAEWAAALPALQLHLDDAGRWSVQEKTLDDGRGYGLWYDQEPIVWLDSEKMAREGVTAWTTAVIAHEIGHAIGVHRHLQSGLMMDGSRGARPACIDAVTLRSVCIARPELCDGSQRVTCE